MHFYKHICSVFVTKFVLIFFPIFAETTLFCDGNPCQEASVFECKLVFRYGEDFHNVATTRLVASGL